MHPDPASEDIPTLFQRLTCRDAEAFGEICRRLWGRLIAVARSRVRREPDLCPVYDEEDALNSGLNLMWQSFLTDNLVPPDGLDDFLRLARTFIVRRITHKLRQVRSTKRQPAGWVYVPDDLDIFACGLPRPEVELISNDMVNWLLSLLCREARAIVELRLEGNTIDQIAEPRGKPRRNIERMFQEIRATWTDAQRDR